LFSLSSFKHFLFFHHIVAHAAIAYCIIISYAHHARYTYTLFFVFVLFGLRVEANKKNKEKQRK
jgi:hypothetical protein